MAIQGLRIAVWFLAAALGLGQAPQEMPKIEGEQMVTFGVTVYAANGLKGDIYKLKEGAQWLPNFKKLKPVGSIYTNTLNIPPRDFTLGFPGVTDMFEWFAIDYTGKFFISNPDRYHFVLVSDDGSRLYIDNKLVIDNDGWHSALALYNSVKLKAGLHTIRVSYFQGPRTAVALMLGVSIGESKDYKVFDMAAYKPPPEAYPAMPAQSPAK